MHWLNAPVSDLFAIVFLMAEGGKLEEAFLSTQGVNDPCPGPTGVQGADHPVPGGGGEEEDTEDEEDSVEAYKAAMNRKVVGGASPAAPSSDPHEQARTPRPTRRMSSGACGRWTS